MMYSVRRSPRKNEQIKLCVDFDVKIDGSGDRNRSDRAHCISPNDGQASDGLANGAKPHRTHERQCQ
jgi:hypothetical protein